NHGTADVKHVIFLDLDAQQTIHWAATFSGSGQYASSTETTGQPQIVVVPDDDRTPPTVTLTGSPNGVQSETYVPSWKWDVQDPSGVSNVHVTWKFNGTIRYSEDVPAQPNYTLGGSEGP